MTRRMTDDPRPEKAAPIPAKVLALAHELWAAAQLGPSEGISDGVARIADALADRVSQEERIREDERRLNWLEANSNVHVQYEGWEEDVWEVYRVNGGRSDREWSKIAESSSLRDAIDLARLRGGTS